LLLAVRGLSKRFTLFVSIHLWPPGWSSAKKFLYENFFTYSSHHRPPIIKFA